MTQPRRHAWHRGCGKSYPTGAKLVSRSTRYGNPYRLAEHGGRYTRDESLRWYRRWLRGDPEAVARAHADGWPINWPYGAALVALIRAELAGRDLVCTGCGIDEACHADLVLRVAAGEDP